MKHGIYSRQDPTPIIGVVEAPSALPFVVGTAPVHTVPGDQSINQLVKLTSWQEVLDTFGYVHDFGRYTLMEALYAFFRLFGNTPVFAVNVFDPTIVAGNATSTAVTLEAGAGTLAVDGALVVELNDDANGTTTYVEGVDYSLAYNESGHPVITRISTGAIPSDASVVYVSHKIISAAKCGVNAAAVISAMDKIDTAYAVYGDIPQLILAPGYSQDPIVMAVMVAKTEEFGGNWYAHALCDISTAAAGGADTHTEAAAWKSTNGYTSRNMDVCWPLVKIGDDVFHMSTILAGELARSDHENGDIPYATGSNRQLPITGACNEAGTEIYLTQKQANDSLNANGITTVINQGARGWVTWGNRTAAWPGDADPANYWRNHRRMLAWLTNRTKLRLAAEVDNPANYRQVEAIINSINIDLNGIAAAGGLVGQAKVEMRQDENPITEMISGHYTFRTTLCPPTAMEAITLVWQIDPTQLNTLFAQ